MTTSGIEPACWSWAVPADFDRWEPEIPPIGTGNDCISASTAARLRRAYENPNDRGEALLGQWQESRCAMCGRTPGHLVVDHDHDTALVRGLLCRSCNTREGLDRRGVFAPYRERPPTAMLGLRILYWDPIRDEYAQPYLPADPSDRRRNNPLLLRDNPMRGIGL